MSLEGNLEELGLGDILQIVSLSRKTGILTLCSQGCDGAVFFRHGQVVRAVSSGYQLSLGDVLLQKGVIDQEVLRQCLALQQENGFCELLGVILVEKFGISQEIIEETVREQIENVVYSLFTWEGGTFKFTVYKAVDTVDDVKNDQLQFVLDHGLNPQFLAMEGTRIFEEHRQATENNLGSNKQHEQLDQPVNSNNLLTDNIKSHHKQQPSAQRHIIIVDDDGPTLLAIADGLTNFGLVTHTLTRSEDTLINVDTLHRSGEKCTVLIDMIMPKMDGSGVLGGLELMELLHNNFKDLHLIIMSDYHHEEAEKTISERGYSFFIKPRRAELDTPEVMDSFLTQIIHAISNSTADLGKKPS